MRVQCSKSCFRFRWCWPQCRPFGHNGLLGQLEDSLEMIEQRHPRVVETFVRELEGPSDSHHLRMATRAGAIRQSRMFRGAVMV